MPSTKRDGCAHSGVTLWGWAVPTLGLQGVSHALRQAQWLCPPRGHALGTGSASLGLAGGPPCPLPSAMAVPTPGSHSGDGQCQPWACRRSPCPLPSAMAVPTPGSHSRDGQCQPWACRGSSMPSAKRDGCAHPGVTRRGRAVPALPASHQRCPGLGWLRPQPALVLHRGERGRVPPAEGQQAPGHAAPRPHRRGSGHRRCLAGEPGGCWVPGWGGGVCTAAGHGGSP